MKTVKRFTTLVLVGVMLAAMLVLPASASGAQQTYTITINTSDTGHQYEAYQIFGGKLTEVTDASNNTRHVLTEIEWGSSIKESGKTTLGDASVQAGKLTNEADAHAFAEALVSGGHLGNPVKQTTEGATPPYIISDLQPGYYLIKDVGGSISSEDYHAYTDYILRVIKDVEVTPKASVPTLSKKVSTVPGRDFAESVNRAIGREVWFELNGSMPSMIGTYTTYKMTFVDTLPVGMDFITGSVDVYINNDGSLDVLKALDESEYTVNYDEPTRKLTVTVTDAIASIKAHDGAVFVSDNIVVHFSAKLNENAVIGKGSDGHGNQNTAIMQYSNDPNKADSFGTTSTESAEVYTYSLQVIKTDSESSAIKLSGAKFLLWRNETGNPTD